MFITNRLGAALRAVLAISLLAAATAPTPALADGWGRYDRGDGYRRHRGDTGTAIATGILGIVLGAAIASGNRREQAPQARYYDGPNSIDGCFAPRPGAGFCYPAEYYMQQGWRPSRYGWMDPAGRVFGSPYDLSGRDR